MKSPLTVKIKKKSDKKTFEKELIAMIESFLEAKSSGCASKIKKHTQSSAKLIAKKYFKYSKTLTKSITASHKTLNSPVKISSTIATNIKTPENVNLHHPSSSIKKIRQNKKLSRTVKKAGKH